MLLVLSAGIVLIAGVLRGLTGFGYSLVAILGLVQIWPPALITPAVLAIEIVLAATLVGDNVLGHIKARWMIPMLVGGALGIAAGVLAIGSLPVHLIRPALDVAVLVSAIAALVHVSEPRLDTPVMAAITGFLVAALIAAFGVGGPFAAVWLMAIGAAPAVIRANLIVFFAFTDIAAVPSRLMVTGFSPELLQMTGFLMIPSLVGALIGGRLVARVNPATWRKIAAYAIAAATAASLVHDLAGWTSAAP